MKMMAKFRDDDEEDDEIEDNENMEQKVMT